MTNTSKPWVRVLILFVATIILGILSKVITGELIPTDPKNTIIFQSAILMIVLGSTFLEKFYTKPADSMVNSFTATITLIPVINIFPKVLWWILLSFNLLVFVLSIICILVNPDKKATGFRKKINDFSYPISTLLGSARVLFSIMFICSIVAFYGIQNINTFLLVAFWGGFTVIWPLKIPEWISSIFSKKHKHSPLGAINRIDWPNLIRVSLNPNINWTSDAIKVFQQPGELPFFVLPLFKEPQSGQILGTGLCVKNHFERIKGFEDGLFYDLPKEISFTRSEALIHLGGDSDSVLLGFVIEGSSISELRLEIWDPGQCGEGKLIWVKIGEKRVYYQITNGIDEEEKFEENRHGFQKVIAIQLGELDAEKGFSKFTWIPPMNSAVFLAAIDFGKNLNLVKENEFLIGNIPFTEIKMGGNFSDSFAQHTAIIGVTGSGKTELAFNIIKHAIEQNIKVICIDITSKYAERLEELGPLDLSLTPDQLVTQYRIENKSQTGVKPISTIMENFLTTAEKKLGILNLDEVSNTKETLSITEKYVSFTLNFARFNPTISPKILIVVDEAHTVMPESNTVGVNDWDSKALVNKIAQIALQGRKYNIGLLVIAQRTATVSKSILSQCNTYLSFNCYDDTSLNFLCNYFGNSYMETISNLPFLNVIAYGKWIKSQRPVIVQIPIRPPKAE